MITIVNFDIDAYLGSERYGRISFRRTDDQRAKTESHLFYLIRTKIRALGHDVIYKRASNDGHLVGNDMWIVRSRNQRDNGFVIYDEYYAIRAAHTVFNREGQIELSIHYWAGKATHAHLT